MMRQRLLRATAVSLLSGAFLMSFTSTAWADNCTTAEDCRNTGWVIGVGGAIVVAAAGVAAASQAGQRQDEEEKQATRVTLAFVAGGWKPFPNDRREAAVLLNGRPWDPGSKDFAAAAARGGLAPLPVTSPGKLFAVLGSQKEGSVERVVFVGHGNQLALGLAGRGARFTSALTSAHLAPARALANRFTKDAVFELFVCQGPNPEPRPGLAPIARAIADTLQVTVRRPRSYVEFCASADRQTRKITRGYVGLPELDVLPMSATPCGRPPWTTIAGLRSHLR